MCRTIAQRHFGHKVELVKQNIYITCEDKKFIFFPKKTLLFISTNEEQEMKSNLDIHLSSVDGPITFLGPREQVQELKQQLLQLIA